MQAGESTTVQEVRILWEMMRIEWGESISKQEVIQGINENEQIPLSPEEIELSKKISELEIEFNRKRYEKDNAA